MSTVDPCLLCGRSTPVGSLLTFAESLASTSTQKLASHFAILPCSWNKHPLHKSSTARGSSQNRSKRRVRRETPSNIHDPQRQQWLQSCVCWRGNGGGASAPLQPEGVAGAGGSRYISCSEGAVSSSPQFCSCQPHCQELSCKSDSPGFPGILTVTQ